MRKIAKRRKKIGINGLIIIFILSLTTISVGYSLLSQELKISGKTRIVNSKEEDESFRMTYQKNSWGQDPYITQFDVTVENISDQAVDSWTFYIDVPENTEIIAFWNVKASIEDNKLILKNESYNGNISIDGKITFGIQLQTYVENYELDGSIIDTGEQEEEKNDEIVLNDNLEVSYNVDSQWQAADGYHTIYSVNIQNNGELINDWSMKIELPIGTVYETSWNANYIVQDNYIIFSNVDYNGTIDSNTAISFSFSIISQSDNIKLTTQYITGT